MENPFRVTVYSKAFVRVGWVNDPIALTVTPRFNGIGTAEITVPVDHRQCAHLEADGARAVIEYYGEQILSGYVHDYTAEGTKKTAIATYTVWDDFWLLTRMLAWPNPGSVIGSQSSEKDIRTGAAETVAKAFITANKANMADAAKITVATSLGRGATITAEARMVPLADFLVDAVDQAGIGLTVKQSGSGVVVDAYTPTVYSQTLSEKAGTLTGWKLARSVDQATRTVAGDSGDGTSRVFVQRTTAARETALGYTIGSFTDASGATDLNAAGDGFLATSGPRSGFSVQMSETPRFRYGGTGGTGVHVGDLVPVDVGGRTKTDVLREATLSLTRDSGLVVSPAVGDYNDDPNRKLWNFVAGALKGVRQLGTH